ncbi:MAG: glycoside hydrolase family 16 protein, partial [Hyphomicrobiales bacterium]
MGLAQTFSQEEQVVDLSKFERTFSEDFDTLDVSAWGEGVNGSRWIAHTPWAGDFGDAKFTDPQPDFPFTLHDGILRIEARKDETGQWRSGLLASTNPKGQGFSQQ